MRRLMRRWAACIGILALLAGVPVAGRADPVCPSQQTTEPVELCGTNIIIASEPSQIRVRIAEESEVAGPEYLPGTEPPQESPFMGALIKEDGARGRHVLVGSFNTDNSGLFNDHRGGSFPRSQAGFPLVPAGEYTLYFVTKPGIESVLELKLYDPAPGAGRREGTVEIHPSRTAELEWITPVNTVRVGPDSNLIYSAGAEFNYGPGQQAFGFFSSAMRGPAAMSMDNYCAYDDKPEGDFPYWPGCPRLNDAGSFEVVYGPYILPDGTRVDYSQPWYIRYPWSTPADHGVNAVGVWRATVGTNYHHSALAWFLTLEN